MNRKNIQSFFALLMAMIMVFAAAVPAFASNSSAVFSEGKTMVFRPGSTYTDSDLFDGLKGVMPGDVLEETILVKNMYRRFDGVKIYLRAEAHDESTNPLSAGVAASGETVSTMSDFLSKLSMKVWNGEALIFDGTPNEVDGLKENVLLGTFLYEDETVLKVELTVPIELGNEYANRVGEVDWIFQIEEYTRPHDHDDDDDPKPKPEPQSDPDEPIKDVIYITDEDVPLGAGPDDLPFGVLPATGDTTAIVPYLCLLAVGVCGLFVTLIAGRKKKRER